VGRFYGRVPYFAVLLPETDATAAQLVLGKLRLRLLEVMKAHSWQMTFSIGAATSLDAPDSLDVIIRMADETMYAIKARGKDNFGRLGRLGSPHFPAARTPTTLHPEASESGIREAAISSRATLTTAALSTSENAL
jgi:hypothetical protein